MSAEKGRGRRRMRRRGEKKKHAEEEKEQTDKIGETAVWQVGSKG